MIVIIFTTCQANFLAVNIKFWYSKITQLGRNKTHSKFTITRISLSYKPFVSFTQPWRLKMIVFSQLINKHCSCRFLLRCTVTTQATSCYRRVTCSLLQSRWKRSKSNATVGTCLGSRGYCNARLWRGDKCRCYARRTCSRLNCGWWLWITLQRILEYFKF